MEQETDLTQPLHVGDIIHVRATGYLRHVTVTKVTPTYVWVEYTLPSTHQHHDTSYRRYPPGVKPPKATNKPQAVHEPRNPYVLLNLRDKVKVTNPQSESGEYYRDMIGEIFDINEALEHPISVRFTTLKPNGLSRESGAFKESELEHCPRGQS